MTLLQVQNITKSFEIDGQRVAAVRGISLEVEPSERIGVVGVSGAGKSTFLRMIGGLETPSSGSVLYNNTLLYDEGDIDAMAEYRLREIGFVFQFHYLIDELSALENVMLPLRIQRMHYGKARQQAADVLASVGLGERLQHRPAQLSGGEQQRAAIARAIVHKPRLLLADEPTGNLDGDTGSAIGKLLQELCTEQGMAMVVVTHNENLASQMQRVVRMQSGSAVATGETA